MACESRDREQYEDDTFTSEILFDENVGCNNNYTGDFINQRWLPFADSRQDLLKDLTKIVNNSHTTRAILQSQTAMTLGRGFVPLESKTIPYLSTITKAIKRIFVADDTIETLNNLVGSVNTDNETLEEVLAKGIFDDRGFGNCFFELIKSPIDGVDMCQIRHLQLKHVALEKKNKETGKIEHVGISCDWTDPSQPITDVPMYPKFAKVNGVQRSIIHVKTYAAGWEYWGLPSNIAGRFWAMIEYLIPRYNISKFKNGFMPSALVQFFGRIPPSEAKKVLHNFLDEMTGEGNNSKVYAQVVSDPANAAKIQTIEDKSEGNFMDLQKLSTQGIIQANRWTTSLSGLANSGSLGSNQQMVTEIDHIESSVIMPIRRKFLQKVVNVFVKENSKIMNGKFNGLMLDIANNRPIGMVALLDPKTTLTIEEQRELLGYDNLEENNVTNEQ